MGYCRLGCAEGPHGSLPVPTAVDRGAPKRSEKGPERRERGGGGDRRRARRLATCRGPGAGGQPLVASPHCCAEQGSALSHQDPGSHASAAPPSCWNQRRRPRPPAAAVQLPNQLECFNRGRGARAGGRDLGEQPGPRAGTPPEGPLTPCILPSLPRGAPHSPPLFTLRKHSRHLEDVAALEWRG